MAEKVARPDAFVAEIARRQHGVASIRQLRSAGLSDDAVLGRVRGGRLHRLHQGVYAVGHLPANVLGLPTGDDEKRDRTRSELERDFLGLCRDHGVSAPEVNVRVGRYLVDFLWRNSRLVVETDGYVSHRGRAAFEDDRQRDLQLRRLPRVASAIASLAMRRLDAFRLGLTLVTGSVLSILTLSGASPAAAMEAPSGPAGWLFDPGAVVEIDLELPQTSIETLEVEPEEEYQPATFTLTAGGQAYGPLEVGARLKGGLGSFRPLSGKAAFKVKFDELVDDQTFFGLEKLTLNNMVQDPSMIHETLAYEAFRSLGIPASRTGYAFVRVNGEAYGLYLNIEVLDTVSLSRWFGSTRHLYEGSYGTDLTLGAAPVFEVDEGKGSKREDLEALIAAANATGGDWSDGMTAVADLNEMTQMWAVERYIGHWDGYAGLGGHLMPNNYYLHSGNVDADAGIFRMLPWGTDQTWVIPLDFGQQGGLLLDRCLADASCAAMYREALVKTRASLPALDLDSRAVELAAAVAPWQGMEVAPRREYTSSEIATGVESTRAFIAGRSGELADWLDRASSVPDPTGPSTAAGTGPSAAVQVKARKLRVGAARSVGNSIATRVEIPAPGSIAQRVFTRVRGRSVAVCADRESRDQAGLVTLRCDLSAAARRWLDRGPLALTIGVRFASPDAKPKLALRRLILPRR